MLPVFHNHTQCIELQSNVWLLKSNVWLLKNQNRWQKYKK